MSGTLTGQRAADDAPAGDAPLPAPIASLPAWWGPVIDDVQRRGLDASSFDLGDLGLEHGHDELTLPDFAAREQPMRRFLVCQRLTLHQLACVYVAIDMLTERTVVLKISRRATDPEARHVIRLRHRHVVTVYDVFVHEGYPTFVLEWCSQGTLDDYARCANDWREVFARLVEGGRGLHYCHERGLVHGDVKLGNFLVADEVGKLADLGIARPPTHAGPVLGTPLYAPPERAQGVWSFAGDVFSFGVVIERALADFDVAPRFASLIAAATHADPQQRPSLPDLLAELAAIRAAIDGDGDVLERRREWQAIEREKAELAHSQRRIELALLDATKPKPRSRWQVAALVAMVVVVGASLGLGAMVLLEPPPTPSESVLPDAAPPRASTSAPVSVAQYLDLAWQELESADGQPEHVVELVKLASSRALRHERQRVREVAEQARAIGDVLDGEGHFEQAGPAWDVALECYEAVADKREIAALLAHAEQRSKVHLMTSRQSK